VVIPPAYPQRLESFVILLEEDDGTVGEVDVEVEGRKATLTEAQEAVNFEDPEQKIQVTNRELQEVAGKLLAGEVAQPKEYVLYFPLDGTRPTASSRRELSRILTEVKRRRVPEITVAGHADRIGDEPINDDLSSKRARWVADQLIEAGIAVDDVEIRSYGESRPAIITPDGTEEPLNRRVEIRVR
jgi:OOP family OmpA-OmpF porin